MAQTITFANLASEVQKTIENTPVVDLHTHLYSADFKDLCLWGIDELLNYHYLQAEMFRCQSDLPYDTFWQMNRTEQADLIWKTLFVEHSPISEACRGVLTVLHKLGIDTSEKDLNKIRKYFSKKTVEEHIDRIFELANVRYVVMANDMFDDVEYDAWDTIGTNSDTRFKGSIRLDGILNTYQENIPKLIKWGYQVNEDLSGSSVNELKRFLEEWIDKTGTIYVSCSFSPDFAYPDDSTRTKILEQCVFPVLEERNLPFAMMIGVRRKVNTNLRSGGDSIGKGDVASLERLLAAFPNVRFLATYLSRENSHSLCVAARKFRNLTPFGCWWFLNNPSLITEITKMRMELLGTSFVPQHSDARILEQLLYKWAHSKTLIAQVLTEKYTDMLKAGWSLTQEELQRDVTNFFSGNFENVL